MADFNLPESAALAKQLPLIWERMLTYSAGVIDLYEQKLESATPSGHLGKSQVKHYNLQFVLAVHFYIY